MRSTLKATVQGPLPSIKRFGSAWCYQSIIKASLLPMLQYSYASGNHVGSLAQGGVNTAASLHADAEH